MNMSRLVKRFIDKHLTSEMLHPEQKIYNVVLTMGIIAGAVLFLSKILENSGVLAMLLAAAILLVTIAAFYMNNRNRRGSCRPEIPLFLICDILFPAIFFASGGMSSGITGYFILCFIITVVLTRGKTSIVLTLFHTAVMAGCYITEALHPSLVTHFSSDAAKYVDIILAIVITSLFSGIIVRFQAKICEREKQKTEEAIRAKADFLANVSHEIRTPLNTIIGLGELELIKGLPSTTLINLEKIHGAGMSLLGIINDLLDISKIDSGSLELIPEDYHTASFINDTISINMVRIGSKPINFKLVIDENLPQGLYGDTLRFRQILNNLLSNAFKFTKEGFVWLKIRAVPITGETQDNDKQAQTMQEKREKILIICSVDDTGTGINEEGMEKLFTAYSQSDTHSSRSNKGVGLGLSITKNLVDLMGGTISAKSTYGKGSSFTVEIPQEISDPAPLGKDLADKLSRFLYYAEKRSKRGNALHPMPYARVLVVDDVITNLDVAKGMMIPYGLAIDCASSGKEAIQKIKEEAATYDAIFMDHMMPEMDGIETVKFIRSNIASDYARKVPIIALTANAIIGNDRMFLENGFQDCLSKPIDSLKLNMVLQKWVRNREKEASPQWAPVIEQMKLEDNINLENIIRNDSAKSDKTNPPKGKASPIEGIDYEEGVKRLANREAVYIRILTSYAAGIPALLDKMRNFEPSMLQDYQITVHGIKGASYGVCANDIGQEAEALERAAKAGNIETILGTNDAFIENMEILLDNISKFLKQPKLQL